MISRELVYKMLDKEHGYAQGWGGPEHDAQWGYMDWLTFAEKYTDEAKLAWSNYSPDERTVRIRLIKAASLLVTALQYLGEESDIAIAGISSSSFPIRHGGLLGKKYADQSFFDVGDA